MWDAGRLARRTQERRFLEVEYPAAIERLQSGRRAGAVSSGSALSVGPADQWRWAVLPHGAISGRGDGHR